MRQLTATQKGFAAESLGQAYAHLQGAEALAGAGQYAASMARAYYAALFAAKAALAEYGRRSKKHKYWIGEFNKAFGEGRGWVPKSYAKLLSELSGIRDAHDYHGAVANDSVAAESYLRRASQFIKKVRSKTPLLKYPEFIEHFYFRHLYVDALEFDFYCPRSYIHKERLQFQVKADNYSPRYSAKIRRAARETLSRLNVSRQDDYVLGWNNRLGQSGDRYLLFLDLDENDEGCVRSALKGRSGWLFKSGEGFHFIGSEVYASRKQWLYRFRQAADSKRLGELIDERHVEFSERRGYSTLRIGSSQDKPFVPFQCWESK